MGKLTLLEADFFVVFLDESDLIGGLGAFLFFFLGSGSIGGAEAFKYGSEGSSSCFVWKHLKMLGIFQHTQAMKIIT